MVKMTENKIENEIENITKVTLKTFINEVAKNTTGAYIRIYPQLNTIITPVKEKGRFGTIDTHIKIEIPTHINNRGKNNDKPIDRIHLHWDKAQTFNAFLMLNPECINIEYWRDSYDSGYLQANTKDFGNPSANIESLAFEGKKGKKRFTVTVNNLHWSDTHLMCRSD